MSKKEQPLPEGFTLRSYGGNDLRDRYGSEEVLRNQRSGRAAGKRKKTKPRPRARDVEID
jgi:hypothetical protein